MKLDVGCDFEYETAVPTPAIFLVRPLPSEPQQFVLEERWETEPSAPFHDYIDGYGNVCRRLVIGPGRSRVRYDATVDVPATVDAFAPDAHQAPVDALPTTCSCT
jgi:hypothetical protein